MACTTCANKGANSSGDGVIKGDLIGGFSESIPFARKVLPIATLRVPNIITFSDNPYLVVGDKFLISGIGAVGGAFTGVAECATVTTAPVLVGTAWEVATDLVMTSLTGNATLSFIATTSAGGVTGFGCATTSTTTAAETLQAVICAGTLNATNFSGYLYTRRPGADGIGFDAEIVANSPVIRINRRVTARKGDRITLSGTAITETSPATVIDVASFTLKDGQKINLVTLNVPVTGVTAPADSAGITCVNAVSKPQAITQLQFTIECGCMLTISVPGTVTSSASFPAGMPYEEGTCGQTAYYYAFHDFTPGAAKKEYCGTVIL